MTVKPPAAPARNQRTEPSQCAFVGAEKASVGVVGFESSICSSCEPAASALPTASTAAKRTVVVAATLKGPL